MSVCEYKSEKNVALIASHLVVGDEDDFSEMEVHGRHGFKEAVQHEVHFSLPLVALWQTSYEPHDHLHVDTAKCVQNTCVNTAKCVHCDYTIDDIGEYRSHAPSNIIRHDSTSRRPRDHVRSDMADITSTHHADCCAICC